MDGCLDDFVREGTAMTKRGGSFFGSRKKFKRVEDRG
jgi:hypothetical protein